jgi:c-di-AMP phosphodiesterase-like protein
MKRKLLPLTLMLVAGLVTVIITFIRNCSIIYKLVSLLIVFVVFYFIGSIIVYVLNYFDKVNRPAEELQDDVLEKDADGEIIGSAKDPESETGGEE